MSNTTTGPGTLDVQDGVLMSIRATGSRRHTVTGTLSPRIKYMSQHWNSEIIYAGGPGSTVEKWQVKWLTNNCSIVAEPTKMLNPRSQLRLHSYSLFKKAFGLYLNLFGEWIVGFPPLHALWSDDYYYFRCLSTVICFKTSVARFYLDDERQLYGRPSLLRTIGSRVSCNRSLSKTLRCHTGWAMLPPASAYWLKYLLVVPLLTCNLLQQQQPGSPD